MQEQLKLSLKNLVDKLISWLDLIIVNTPNIILAILVFMLTYFLSKKLSGWASRIMQNRIKQGTIRNLFVNFISIFVILLGLFLALSILNLDKALTSLIAGAGVVGLAVGLALQGTLTNTFAGISLSLKNVINIGDFIETNGYAGSVESISLRHTQIRAIDSNIVIIPNSLVLDTPFKNYGLTNEIRITIECGVAYESNLREVEKITKKIIEESFPHKKENIEFHYLSFGDSAINFQIRFWTKAVERVSMLEAKSKAIILLKEGFDKHGIDIPYPMTRIISN